MLLLRKLTRVRPCKIDCWPLLTWTNLNGGRIGSSIGKVRGCFKFKVICCRLVKVDAVGPKMGRSIGYVPLKTTRLSWNNTTSSTSSKSDSVSLSLSTPLSLTPFGFVKSPAGVAVLGDADVNRTTFDLFRSLTLAAHQEKLSTGIICSTEHS